MGNDLPLLKSCRAVHELCTQQYNGDQFHEDKIILKKNRAKSTEEIKLKILKYIEQNRLQLYPVREKKVLQTLVSVDQQHLGDKIVELDKSLKFLEQEKKQLTRKKKNQPQKSIVNQNKQRQQQQNKALEEKALKLNDQIARLKYKRKKLFQETECLLLEDFDMILEQIPKFDHNYHHVSNILSLSQSMVNNGPKKFQANISNNNQTSILTKNPNNDSVSKVSNTSKTEQSAVEVNDNSFNKSKILKPLHQKKERKQEEKLKEVLRIEDKKLLKKNYKITHLGSQVLQANDLLMIVPIECFSGIGALRNNHKTGLPSQASLFQILINKIKAVNIRRGCRLEIAFLVNEKFVTEFNEEISKATGLQSYTSFEKIQVNSNISNHQSDYHYQQPIHYHVIAFKNIWPSFDLKQKILLGSESDEIMFSTHDGDLIAFIENSLELKQLIEKHKYVNITNINNILSQIGDAYVLGYLQQNEGVDIAVKVLKPASEHFQLRDYFALDENGFVSIKEIKDNKVSVKQNEPIQQSENSKGNKYIRNRNFLDIEQYYIKSRIFTTESGPLKRLLMSRISRRLNSNSQIAPIESYLHLSIQSIFYSKFTAFIMIDEDFEFSHVKTDLQSLKPDIKKNGWIGYSRYCKRLLGLKPNQEGNEEEEIVEIDAGILHKGSQQLMKILRELKKVKQIGFPIILYSDFFNNSQTVD